MQALIDPRDGQVHDIRAEPFPVAPPLEWRPAPDGLTRQHRITPEGRFVPPCPGEFHHWNGEDWVADADAELAGSIARIREEAARRIAERYPDWKQRNMLARAFDLLRLGERQWSDEQRAEIEANDAAWAAIRKIRAASDVLEQTLPDDPGEDRHWPEAGS